MKDMRGVEIEVGDTVAYPGRASSSLWMNIAKVEAIDANNRMLHMVTVPSGSWRGRGGSKVRTAKLDRLVVIK